MRERRTARFAVKALLTSLVGGAVVVGVLLVLASKARAEVENQLLQVGVDLSGLSELEQTAGTLPARTLLVNGIEILVGTQTVETPLEEVLDGAALRCGGQEGSMFDPALGNREEGHGFVACFPKLGRLGPLEMLDIGRAFIDGGDLSGLGRFQYTYARETPTGTHVIEATIPTLDMSKLLPKTGDVPGLDVSGIPRPVGGRRILSAAQVDSPHQFVVYSGADGSAASVRAEYRSLLAREGWDVYDDDTNSNILVAFRGRVMAMVILQDQPEGVSVTVASGL